MNQAEKIQEFVLLDQDHGLYLCKRGYTTGRQYARRFTEEAASNKIKQVALRQNGTLLIKEKAEDTNE